MGFRAKGQGSNQETYNSRQWNQGMNYYEDKYRDWSRDRDDDQRKKDDYKEKSDKYIPPGSQDPESKMEAFSSKMVKG